MSKVKKLLTLPIVALCILALAGCSKAKGQYNTIDKDTIYREEELKLSLPENFNANYNTMLNGKLYMLGSSYSEKDYIQTSQVVITDINTGESKAVKVGKENSWVSRIVPFEDGSFIIFYEDYTVDDTDPENPIYNSRFVAERYDASGKSVKLEDLNEKCGITYVNSLAVVPNGCILFSYDRIIRIDNELNVLKKKELSDSESNFNGVYKLKDSSLVVSKWGEKEQEFYRFNPDTLETGEALKATVNLSNYSVMQGAGYDLYLTDSTQVLGYNFGDAEPKALFNFVNSDLYVSYFNFLEALDERTFIAYYNDWDDKGVHYHLCKYNKVNPEDVVDKEILSLGCVWLDNSVRRFVVDFNRKSEKYRISVVDYSNFNTNDDYNAGMNKFNSDVASGKGPDIVICSGNNTMENYVSKGLFADLGKLLDKDPDLSREDILPNILEACSKNGKLYQIVPNFEIFTAIGKKSEFGDRTGWTMQEMLDYMKTLPEGKVLYHDMNREGFLTNLFKVSAAEFIDPKTVTCNFDSDEFKAVLEYMKTLLPEDKYYEILYGNNEEFDWEGYENEVRMGKASLMTAYIYDTWDYKNYLRVRVGEDMAFMGYPNKDGKGSCIIPNMCIGVSSKCRNIDGAWEFVRKYLLDDYQEQNNGGFSSTVKGFEKTCMQLKEKPSYEDEGGNIIYYDDTRWIGGKEVTIEPLTDAEVEDFKNFVYSVDKLVGNLDDVTSIIFEEAAPFFEGQKSVEEVVKIIQSRASLFVSEKQ